MTKIQWTEETWNPVRGCWNGKIRLVPEKLEEPLRWRKPRRVFVTSMSDLFHEGVPDEYIDKVFAVMGLSPRHTFQVLTKRADRMRTYATGLHPDRLVQAALLMGVSDEGQCHLANWIGGWNRWRGMPDDGNPLDGSQPRWPLPNVWLGCSVEDQKRADERIPVLLDTPAAVRFLSCEPLLDSISLLKAGAIRSFSFPEASSVDGSDGWYEKGLVDWVIVGGESGPGARPCNVEWIRSIVQQCKAAQVPCFTKQLGQNAWSAIKSDHLGRIEAGLPMGSRPVAQEPWRLLLRDKKGGEPAEWPEDLRVREFPE